MGRSMTNPNLGGSCFMGWFWHPQTRPRKKKSFYTGRFMIISWSRIFQFFLLNKENKSEREETGEGNHDADTFMVHDDNNLVFKFIVISVPVCSFCGWESRELVTSEETRPLKQIKKADWLLICMCHVVHAAPFHEHIFIII